MSKVNRRGGFSDRNGIKPVNTIMQLKEFDQHTRTQMSNCLNSVLHLFVSKLGLEGSDHFWYYIYTNIYDEYVDRKEGFISSKCIHDVCNTILQEDYDDVLTLIEGIVQYIVHYHNKTGWSSIGKDLIKSINDLFKREFIGYRFVGGIIAPISDESETDAISEATANPFDTVREHISKATRFLSDRNNPDYKNCIKESITAVEAMCNIITNSHGTSATLGAALKKLEENNIPIHGALKAAFEKLYGYTNDANGIRHAGNIDGPDATFEEAKYMLVSCSAFVNYLTALYSKINNG